MLLYYIKTVIEIRKNTLPDFGVSPSKEYRALTNCLPRQGNPANILYFVWTDILWALTKGSFIKMAENKEGIKLGPDVSIT